MHICFVWWSGLEGVRASARGEDCVSQEFDVGGSTFGLVGGGAFQVMTSGALEGGPGGIDGGGEVRLGIDDEDVVEVGGNELLVI